MVYTKACIRQQFLTGTIVLLLFNHSGFSQHLTKFETGLSLGIRNLGVFVAYKPVQNFDICGGVGLMRYSNLDYNVRVRMYPLKPLSRKSFTGGTMYIGTGYKHSFKAMFNAEDSRDFVNTFAIPTTDYWENEIGYRFNFSQNGEDEYIKKNEKVFHSDVSVGLTYSKAMGNVNATLKNGADLDGQLNKINKFLNGKGLGFQIQLHITIIGKKSLSTD